jgi:hypothetical protein
MEQFVAHSYEIVSKIDFAHQYSSIAPQIDKVLLVMVLDHPPASTAERYSSALMCFPESCRYFTVCAKNAKLAMNLQKPSRSGRYLLTPSV